MDEEIYILARLEKGILQNSKSPVRNMNQQLHLKFPHRSVNHISCLRRERYKTVFQEIAGDIRTSDESFYLSNSNFMASLLDHDYDFSILTSSPGTHGETRAESIIEPSSASNIQITSSPYITRGTIGADHQLSFINNTSDGLGNKSFNDVIRNTAVYFNTLPAPFFNDYYLNFNEKMGIN